MLASASHSGHDQPSTSLTLLQAIKSAGNHDAWSEFFQRYWRLVWWHARHAGLNDADSEDVVQEVFIALARKAADDRLAPSAAPGQFRSLLRTITLRRVADRLRAGDVASQTLQHQEHPNLPKYPKHQKHAADVEDAGRDEAARTQADDSHNADQWTELERRSELLRCLDLVGREVEPVTIQAFQLYVLEGWTVRRVSEYLNIKPDSVYAAKSRVIVRLREHLLSKQELAEATMHDKTAAAARGAVKNTLPESTANE